MRYQTDPLASPPPRKTLPEVPVEREMVLEDVETGWVGAVGVRVQAAWGKRSPPAWAGPVGWEPALGGLS